MSAPLPERIGRYRVNARIGRGAMGVVYAAWDDEAAREVAIKIMMADLEDEPETRARFLREAQAAGCLVHSNIITIFDMGEEEGRVYLVMELLRGQTLNEYLARPEGVSLDRKIDLMMQVCDGLAAAHAHGVFHRDIKPGNLFVQRDGGLKILDFGVARLASSTMTASGYIIGTPDYMSPEQARGREVDQRSDVFSAGAVFYFMLTGRKPFAARDLPSVLRKVQSEAPDPMSEAEAPPPLGAIIARALAKEPADRYQWMGEMRTDLGQCRQLLAEGERRRAEQKAERERTMRALTVELEQLRGWFGFAGAVPAAGGGPGSASPASGWASQATSGSAAVASPDTADEAARARLADEVERLRVARRAMEVAERALSAGRPREALPSLEQVARTLPELQRAREALDRCRLALAELQKREERLRTLVTEARAAAAHGDWSLADERAGEVLQLDPASAEAAAIVKQVGEAREREAQARARRFEQYATQAAEAIGGGRLEDGAEAIRRARGVDASQETALAALEVLLAEAREKRSAAVELARRTTEAVASAHHAFEAGQREEAIASLLDLLNREPEAPGLADEIARLRAEAARIVAQERRRASARAELDRARGALERRDFAGAIAAAESALRYEDRLPEATRLIALAEARQREQAEAAARAAKVSAGVARAQQLLAAGSLAKAAREVARVLAIEPTDPSARELEIRVHRLEAEARAREEQRRIERERARRVERLVKDARSALRARRFEEARGLVGQALGLDPKQREALALADELAKAVARATHEEEDTVAQAAPADPEDTVSLAPPVVAAWRRWGVLFRRFRGPRQRSPGRRR